MSLEPIEGYLREGDQLDPAAHLVDRILSGSRLRTRRSYAAVAVCEVLGAGFGLLATFSAPHYSVALGFYAVEKAELLIGVLGEVRPNPHHVRRQ